MSWNHRTAVWTSSAGIAIVLSALALVVFRLSSSPAGATQAQMAVESLAGPAVGPHGQRLTRAIMSPALAITPSQLQSSGRREIAAGLHIHVGRKPLLVPVSSRLAHVWEARHLVGVRVVKMKNWVPRAGVPLSVLTLAEGPGRVSAKRWIDHQGVWVPAEIRVMHLSLSYRLTRALAPLAKGGAIWVLQKNGQVLAAVGSERMLWGAAPVGLSALPPLLGKAASEVGLSARWAGGAGGIDALAQQWGSRPERQAIGDLGFGQLSLDAIKVQSHALPKTMGPALLTSGSGLSASPVEVGRAYLPLLNHQGLLPALSLRAPSQKTFRTAISAQVQRDVIQALPRVKEGGLPFRIWRPAASPAVVMDANQGTVAVLSSQVAGESLPVAAALAAH